MSDTPTPTPDAMPAPIDGAKIGESLRIAVQATDAAATAHPTIVSTIQADAVKTELFLAKVINWLSAHKYTAVLILGTIIGFILGHLI